MTNTSWRTLSQNPVAPEVHRHRWLQTKELCRPIRGRVGDFIQGCVAGRTLLDIGCAEHDSSHWDRPEWQHAKLKKWAKTLTGIDIIPEAAAALCERGYDVRCVDATSSCDLGLRFERVMIGDVIEHVSDPVALIRFSLRHLVSDGVILIHTPNPFYCRNFLRVVREGIFIENAEHISWMTTGNMMEISERAGATMKSYHPITRHRERCSPLYWALRIWSGREPELLARSHYYMLGK